MKELQDYFKNDDLAISVWQGEIWKPVIGYENKYHVSNYGRVKNIGNIGQFDSRNRPYKREEKILVNRLSSNEYLITFNNKFIHRLVAQHFIPNPNNLPQVNHKDGNKINNHFSNLEWCTVSENVKHAFAIGLNKGAIGELGGNCKLTTNEVLEIKNLYRNTDLTQKEIGTKYNISKQQVQKIVNNTRWKHLTEIV